MTTTAEGSPLPNATKVSAAEETVQTPLDPEQVKTEANAQYKLGNYAAAADLYTQCVDAAPQNATYLANRAAAYLMLNRYKDAAEDCRRAVSLDSNFVKVGFSVVTMG